MSGISNIEEGIVQLDTFTNTSQVINNDFERKWMYVENRCSYPLAIGSIPKGAGSIPTFLQTVRPLSQGCYPIDASQDVVIGYAITNITQHTSIFGANSDTGVLNVQDRNVPYKLSDDGGLSVNDLYPISNCLIVSRRVSINSGGTATHFVVDFGQGGTILFTRNVLNQKFDATKDWCIMGTSIILHTTTAGNQPSDLAGNVVMAGDNEAISGEIFPMAGAAGVTPAAQNTGLIPLPGACGIIWENDGPGAMTLRISYWIGIPGRFSGGQI